MWTIILAGALGYVVGKIAPKRILKVILLTYWVLGLPIALITDQILFEMSLVNAAGYSMAELLSFSAFSLYAHSKLKKSKGVG